ncbi:hypothetical protein F4679DRAFT_581917 [Xylaria curta]|nr:hypothetical protein F4679DRAFT_581917 [Xylaria curta]
MSHDSPNPRYKGKNYDPNYHGRRNQTGQQRPQSNDPNHVDYPPIHHPYHGNPFQQQRPHSRHSPAQQQRQQYPHHHHHHHPQQYHYQHPDVHQYRQQQPYQQFYRSQQQQQQQQQQHYITGSSAAAMQAIENFRNEVHKAVVLDSEGDTHMCMCQNPGDTLCFHGIAKLYQNQLVRSAALQHDIVELLNFLIDREPYGGTVSTQLAEYINRNPATPLRLIVETMGIDGLVTRGFGATVGPAGIELLVDTTAPSDIR